MLCRSTAGFCARAASCWYCCSSVSPYPPVLVSLVLVGCSFPWGLQPLVALVLVARRFLPLLVLWLVPPSPCRGDIGVLDSNQLRQPVVQLLMMLTDWSAKRALRKQIQQLNCLPVDALPASLLPRLDMATSHPIAVMPGCHPIW